MDRRQPHGSPGAVIPRQCTATSKRSGEQCRKPAMQGRTVCRAHGGATPRGTASPHYRHGRWSKDLPTQLVQRYQEARLDEDLLSLREEVALVDMQIGTLLANPSGQAGQPALGQLVELRRRLVESEIKHRVLTGQMLAIDNAVALAGALAATVREHVQDPMALEAIQRDLERLLGDAS